MKIRKRLLAMLLSCMVLLTIVPTVASAAEAKEELYVGGVRMASGQYLEQGKDTPTSTKPKDNYAYYKDGVLVLHNYSYEGDGAVSKYGPFSGVCYKGKLKLVLEGENSLTITKNPTGEQYNVGVFVKGDLTIDAASNADKLAVSGGTGLYAENNMEINAGSFEIDAKYIYGIFVNKLLTINGGRFDVTSKQLALVGGWNAKIIINGGTFDLESKTGNTIYSRETTINGGSILARDTSEDKDDDGNNVVAFENNITFADDLTVLGSFKADGSDPEPYNVENSDKYRWVKVIDPAESDGGELSGSIMGAGSTYALAVIIAAVAAGSFVVIRRRKKNV